MYIKSTDASGMPMPLRIFDYSERKQEKASPVSSREPDFVSRSEFDAFKHEITESLNGIRGASDIGEG